MDDTSTNDCDMFLQEDLRDLANDQLQPKRAATAKTNNNDISTNTASSNATVAAAKTKPLTSYFGFVSTKSFENVKAHIHII